MGHRIRIGLVAVAAIAVAGCGVGVSAQLGAPANQTLAAKQAPVKDWAFKGISGHGKIRDHFTIWEYDSIRFKAELEGQSPDMTWSWDTNGHIWGKQDKGEIHWSGPWSGWYTVECTVRDGAGRSQKREVTVHVMRVPTPPPYPPIPHP